MSTEVVNKCMSDKELGRSQEFTRKMIAEEDRMGFWVIYDSPLAEGERAFQYNFRKTLPKEKSHEPADFRKYIEENLAEKKGSAIGIELGGTASALFSGFTTGFFEKTAGLNLTDYRNLLSHELKNKDEQRNHTVIEGDILKQETKEKFESWLGDGRQVDLIFERMIGGQKCLPDKPRYMAQQAGYWYEKLAQGGLMFIETPVAFRRYMREWEKFIKQEHKDDLEIQSDGIYIRMKKLKDGPLPLLSKEQVEKNKIRRTLLRPLSGIKNTLVELRIETIG